MCWISNAACFNECCISVAALSAARIALSSLDAQRCHANNYRNTPSHPRWRIKARSTPCLPTFIASTLDTYTHRCQRLRLKGANGYPFTQKHKTLTKDLNFFVVNIITYALHPVTRILGRLRNSYLEISKTGRTRPVNFGTLVIVSSCEQKLPQNGILQLCNTRSTALAANGWRKLAANG